MKTYEKLISLKFYKQLIVILVSFLVFQGCSKDDEDNVSDFYKNAFKSAKAESLKGTWAIFEVEFNGQNGAVPKNFPNCNRDFFIFGDYGIYNEFLFPESNCIPTENTLNWELNYGVIILSDSFNNQQELVIISLTDSKLVFKAQFDVDLDGNLDILTFIARRYTPSDIDLYSNSFIRDGDLNTYSNQIRFSWKKYDGFYTFNKYEIYRSVDNCSKNNAQLISTITDVNTTFYIDETPPVQNMICYFFKIYNNEGLIGESNLVSVNTDQLTFNSVELFEPKIINNSIELSWKQYDGFYFSHYQIIVQNYFDGYGYGYQETIIKEIYDINITSFIDNSPPFVKNPVYKILVYDIFGNKSSINNNEVNFIKTAIFKKPEILELDYVVSAVIDTNKPYLYVFGKNDIYGDYAVTKYNYATKTTEATFKKSGTNITNIDIQLVENNAIKELAIAQLTNNIDLYNTVNLEFKYTLKPAEVSSIHDFAYIGNNFWVIIDSKNIYTYQRENANFSLVSKTSHFSNSLNDYRYHLLKISNNQIIVGHFNEPKSMSFTMNSIGEITDKKIVNSPLKSKFRKKTIYNSQNESITNLLENRIYSSTTFNLIKSFETPYFPSSVSTNGNFILGTNNNSEWTIDENSLHKKEVQVFDINTNSTKVINTLGYSHLIFEDYLGKTISISSGFKRENLERNTSKRDIFVEIIE